MQKIETAQHILIRLKYSLIYVKSFSCLCYAMKHMFTVNDNI